jgi:hypothetical protein
MRLARYAAAWPSGLWDCSRPPRHSPARTNDEFAQRVIEVRHESRNSWGERKLARLLADGGGLQGNASTAPQAFKGLELQVIMMSNIIR